MYVLRKFTGEFNHSLLDESHIKSSEHKEIQLLGTFYGSISKLTQISINQADTSIIGCYSDFSVNVIKIDKHVYYTPFSNLEKFVDILFVNSIEEKEIIKKQLKSQYESDILAIVNNSQLKMKPIVMRKLKSSYAIVNKQLFNVEVYNLLMYDFYQSDKSRFDFENFASTNSYLTQSLPQRDFFDTSINYSMSKDLYLKLDPESKIRYLLYRLTSDRSYQRNLVFYVDMQSNKIYSYEAFIYMNNLEVKQLAVENYSELFALVNSFEKLESFINEQVMM